MSETTKWREWAEQDARKETDCETCYSKEWCPHYYRQPRFCPYWNETPGAAGKRMANEALQRLDSNSSKEQENGQGGG